MPTDNDNICYTCENMIDVSDYMWTHYNRCKIHGECVDCTPNYCNGIDYMKKELIE